MGAYYAGPGNKFWRTLHEINLTPELLKPDQYERLLEFGIGLTDVSKTKSGSDAEVGGDSFDVPRLVAALECYSPSWIAFNGKNAARAALRRKVAYGLQPEELGGVSCFVLPSTSGAASGFWDIEHWRTLAQLAGS